MVVRADAPGFKDLARTTKSSFLLWNCVHILLVILNMPKIGVLVKLLSVPFRYMFPRVLFFIAIGVALGAGIT
jgi:TctA family transporter